MSKVQIRIEYIENDKVVIGRENEIIVRYDEGRRVRNWIDQLTHDKLSDLIHSEAYNLEREIITGAKS